MIGNVLGNRYRILREIGAGGMAKVYLAEDIKSKELVAVKLLYPQFGEDLSFIQRFNREAKLASTLTDPHIVRVLDYGADRDLHYLVMEFVEGQNLNDRLKEEKRFEWRYALELIDQLATALEQAHAYGVIHRDIKPQNIMLNESGMLKVLDFGIARIPTLPSLTQSGFIGSPYYASPEQAMGEEVDIRSDIYSTGVVLYELLSGNIPFDAKSPWSIVSQHITSEPPPINLSNEKIPQNVQDLLERMLAKRPEDRFQTPIALRQAIAAVLAGQPLPRDASTIELAIDGDNSPLIDSLVERAASAEESKEWLRAADLLSQASKLDPDNEEITKELARVEANARLSSLYRSGKRAMDSGRWEEALNHFNVLVALQADYLDTHVLLDACHKALKEENLQQFISTRYQEGVAHFETRRWPEAIAALEEVQSLSPGYEQTASLLAQAHREHNPNFLQKVERTLHPYVGGSIGRLGALVVGIVIIVILSMMLFGNNNQVAGDNDRRDQFKVLYDEAQAALEAGEIQLALAKLDQIYGEDPDYADVAALRRELNATPTPTPSSTPTPAPTVIIVATATPENALLAQQLDEAEAAVTMSDWSQAIELLIEVRAEDPAYQEAKVTNLLCDAYAGRGADQVSHIEPNEDQAESIARALADFEAGQAECPRRNDLQEQAERARAYLSVLDAPANDYATRIQTLTPIVAAAPEYADGLAKLALYQAYLARATEREQSMETVAAALGDYEAALALNVDDPGEAQTRRASLLLLFTQRPPSDLPVPAGTDSATRQPTPRGTVQPTATAVRPAFGVKYAKPDLLAPPDDSVFAGKFAEVILEWDPVGNLAPDEYYDLTIMHLFADEPKYTGSIRTRDTRVQLTQDIGVGEAGGDRFYWWVTVRKDNTAPTVNSLDLPLSPRSDAKTFIWSP